jgi:hypothetical protein
MDVDDVFSKIENIVNSKYPPKNINIINNAGIDNKRLSGFLKSLGLPYNAKQVLSSFGVAQYVDEFVMLNKVKFPYYIAVLDNSLDLNFLEGLNLLVNKDMEKVLYAGRDSCYFTISAVHQVCKSGIKEYISKEGYHDNVYNYKEILNRASKNA